MDVTNNVMDIIRVITKYRNNKAKNENCEERIAVLLKNNNHFSNKLDIIEEINTVLRECPGKYETELLTFRGLIKESSLEKYRTSCRKYQ
jgi:hypothetical protein